MISKIHVNQQNIKANQESGQNLPVITVWKFPKGEPKIRIDCHSVEIQGPSRVIYKGQPTRDDNPDTSVRVWIETDSEVICS